VVSWPSARSPPSLLFERRQHVVLLAELALLLVDGQGVLRVTLQQNPGEGAGSKHHLKRWHQLKGWRDETNVMGRDGPVTVTMGLLMARPAKTACPQMWHDCSPTRGPSTTAAAPPNCNNLPPCPSSIALPCLRDPHATPKLAPPS
jgi:hypothetical protein